jgi:hypothetical protein
MRKDCVYEGKCYSHGSNLKLKNEKMVCMDGQWEQDLQQARPGLIIAPGENLRDM